jgi:hypothetical protein
VELLALDQIHLVQREYCPDSLLEPCLLHDISQLLSECLCYLVTQPANAAAAVDGTTDSSGSSSTVRPEWLDRVLPTTNSDRIGRFVCIDIH